ncbi:MAG: hypothetical protein DRQ88_08360 [Epsilonproteobacteria bacterium]|nr:MAG: hypothetical protein DRQ89_06710 [Campylobacterota bacterium]RLA65941.1 MAG: hypothetical protein DRQ88_08360 [Campylobacterota bacterium]
MEYLLSKFSAFLLLTFLYVTPSIACDVTKIHEDVKAGFKELSQEMEISDFEISNGAMDLNSGEIRYYEIAGSYKERVPGGGWQKSIFVFRFDPETCEETDAKLFLVEKTEL